jgi:hypothetical protein
LLRNAILDVCIQATKGELLSCVVACLLEGVVVKVPVAGAVVVEDFHSMFSSVLLKSKLGGESFCQQIVELRVDEAETAVGVDQDGGALIALPGKFAFQLRVETHFGGHHLVNGDTLSRFGCNENFTISLGFLASPGKLGHCPKKVACTLGRHNLDKHLWHLAIESKLLELREAQVAKAVVPAHKACTLGRQNLDKHL